MKQEYQYIRFQAGVLAMIRVINSIVADYIKAGLRLTTRQIYYQLVAHHGLPNTEKSYRNTARIINDGKMAGLIDWEAIEDRTRSFIKRSRWSGGKEILESAASSFHMDMWVEQECRPFVIIEKEALVGVLEGVCHRYDVPLLAARGYPSGSVLREFCVDDLKPIIHEQKVVIIHLGDHDPSGIDMSRDLEERINIFTETEGRVEYVDLDRIALNMSQIKTLKPPPNPAKSTDARFESYYRQYGPQSWELDAIDARALAKLVETRIKKEIDTRLWQKRLDEIEDVKARITEMAEEF